MSMAKTDDQLRNRILIMHDHANNTEHAMLQLIQGNTEIGQVSFAPASLDLLEVRHPDPRDLQGDVNYDTYENSKGRRIAIPGRNFRVPEITIVLRCSYEVRVI